MLGPEFSQRVSPWPHIVSALMDRLALRARWLALELAVASTRRVDTGLLLALWHCADRWGHVTPDGVLLHLPLTQQTLGEVIGARRPSVSTAVATLEEAGKLRRPSLNDWLLLGDPPTTANPGNGSTSPSLTR